MNYEKMINTKYCNFVKQSKALILNFIQNYVYLTMKNYTLKNYSNSFLNWVKFYILKNYLFIY